MKIILTFLMMTTAVEFEAFAQDVKAPLFSPIPSKETATEMLKRPLVICKREVSAKEAEKLAKKDPESLTFRNGYNNYFNEGLKLYFDTLYAGSKNITIKTEAEVNALVSAHSREAVVLQSSNMSRSFLVNGKRKSDDTYSFRMFLPENEDEELIISFMGEILSDADFVFLAQQINSTLQKAVSGESQPSYDYSNKNTADKLRDLKLIVNLQKINEDVTIEDIKKNYTYPIEFVDSLGMYEDIITGHKAGYAYIAQIWSSSLWGAGYVAVDAGTGEILSILSAGGVRFAIGWQPKKTGNYSMDKYNKQFAFDVIKFKVRYELKAGHFKYFNKFAKESK